MKAVIVLLALLIQVWCVQSGPERAREYERDSFNAKVNNAHKMVYSNDEIKQRKHGENEEDTFKIKTPVDRVLNRKPAQTEENPFNVGQDTFRHHSVPVQREESNVRQRIPADRNREDTLRFKSPVDERITKRPIQTDGKSVTLGIRDSYDVKLNNAHKTTYRNDGINQKKQDDSEEDTFKMNTPVDKAASRRPAQTEEGRFRNDLNTFQSHSKPVQTEESSVRQRLPVAAGKNTEDTLNIKSPVDEVVTKPPIETGEKNVKNITLGSRVNVDVPDTCTDGKKKNAKGKCVDVFIK